MEGWGQYDPCPARRTAIEEEQTRVYQLLNGIMELSISDLSAAHNQRARVGLLELLGYLEFDV